MKASIVEFVKVCDYLGLNLSQTHPSEPNFKAIRTIVIKGLVHMHDCDFESIGKVINETSESVEAYYNDNDNHAKNYFFTIAQEYSLVTKKIDDITVSLAESKDMTSDSVALIYRNRKELIKQSIKYQLLIMGMDYLLFNSKKKEAVCFAKA